MMLIQKLIFGIFSITQQTTPSLKLCPKQCRIVLNTKIVFIINYSYYNRTSPSNFAFDTRFLKPAAAAALLNLSCSQIPSSLFGSSGGASDKEKFPMIDMSSTQTLLSMVRSASAVAANNLESNLKASGAQNHKRPNSPLDLSSRDLPNTPPPPPLKKSKLRNPLLDGNLNLKSGSNPTLTSTTSASTTSPCPSSCSTGCSEEAQIMINWTVEEVCRFVATIDLCKDYVEVRKQESDERKLWEMCRLDGLVLQNTWSVSSPQSPSSSYFLCLLYK